MWFEMCGICGKEYGTHEIKDGKLCGHCFERLPESIQKRCKSFTKREMIRLNKQIVEPDIWGRIGALGIGKDMISINGKGIRLKNLKRISLHFHPWKAGERPGTVIGRATVIVELIRPHIVLEEPLLWENMTVFYHISQKKITYKYPCQLELLIGMVQKCLKKWNHSMAPNREKACSLLREYSKKRAEDEKRIRNERSKKEAEKKAEEMRRKAEEARKRTEREKRAEEAKKKAYEEQKNKACRDGGDGLLQKAKDLFQVEKLYTKNELKEKRRRLLKKYHPDMGGSEEMAKKINTAYDILVKYAA